MRQIESAMKDIHQIFFHNCSKMERIKAIIGEIAGTDITTLITGESGTGKELVAQTIHRNSHRRLKPFIKVNCAAIPRSLLESELFGFERGAFTGATLKKPGKFELANGGTLLLNEIGEVDISVQAKLLQVLQDREFSRLGGDGDIAVNVRVITTTQDHLEKSMMEGRFRGDLFFRINVISIVVPPLRERREQILPFCRYFFDLYKIKYAKPISFLSSGASHIFQEYDWPGNIRELENMIKRIVLFGEEEVIQGLMQNQLETKGTFVAPEIPLKNDIQEEEIPQLRQVRKKAAEEAERDAIQRVLLETHWNRREAAKVLQVGYKALLYKIEKYRLAS